MWAINSALYMIWWLAAALNVGKTSVRVAEECALWMIQQRESFVHIIKKITSNSIFKKVQYFIQSKLYPTQTQIIYKKILWIMYLRVSGSYFIVYRPKSLLEEQNYIPEYFKFLKNYCKLDTEFQTFRREADNTVQVRDAQTFKIPNSQLKILGVWRGTRSKSALKIHTYYPFGAGISF